MAAFRDDQPLVEGVDEDWDEFTTKQEVRLCAQSGISHQFA